MDKAKWQQRGKLVLSIVFLVAVAWIVIDRGSELDWKEITASLLRFEVSYGKAYAALAMGRESRQVLQKAKDKAKEHAAVTKRRAAATMNIMRTALQAGPPIGAPLRTAAGG